MMVETLVLQKRTGGVEYHHCLEQSTEKDDHVCSACDNVKQEQNEVVCECACMQVPVISRAHVPQQTAGDNLGWEDSVNSTTETATSLMHEASDKKQQGCPLQTESFETVSSRVTDQHTSLYSKNSFTPVSSHFEKQHSTPCLTHNLGTASSHRERQNNSSLKNGPKIVRSNHKDPDSSHSISKSCKHVKISSTKRNSPPKIHPTPGGLGVHVKWESEYRLVERNEGRELWSDVILLYSPVVVVCIMIVCITLSSCIMGYI